MTDLFRVRYKARNEHAGSFESAPITLAAAEALKIELEADPNLYDVKMVAAEHEAAKEQVK